MEMLVALPQREVAEVPAHAGALCQTAEIDGDCRSNDHNKSGISHIVENPALFRFVEPLGGIFCFFHMKYSFVFYCMKS